MELIILNKARKDIKSIAKSDIENILDKIDCACQGNTSNIKHLTNHDPKYRLRVGNYRVLFDIENDIMLVARILHRKESYNK